MKKFLEKLNTEKLLDFLAEYAANDAKFANAIKVRFEKPKFEEELKKMENAIDNALADTSDYRRNGGWGYISFDTSNIIEEIQQRAEQGHVRLAFAQIGMLYRKLLENFEYQDVCEISDAAEDCLGIMAEIADKAVSEEDKKYIFEHCIELAELEDGKDYGADYEDKLLRIAAKFVTLESRAALEDVLARFDFKWREEEFKLVRLEIIRKLEGEGRADDFIAENLRFPKIREIAFAKAIAGKNFADGERLCFDALSAEKDQQYYGISPWLYKLYSVYEMMENAPKMAAIAEEILLKGNLAYYDKLKTLLEKQAVWGDSYSELLHKCELKLSYTQYMEILAKEKECDLLLEQVKKHTEQVYHYGKLLAEKYPLEICAVFTEQITKDAAAAYGRESYNKVCSRILCFAQAGYQAESIKMINGFKSEYKRKPAFVDELKKIGAAANEPFSR